MADRSEQLKIYITEAEKKQLKEWSEKTGKSLSELGREAVLEYTDHDRTARIEEKVDQILDHMGGSDGRSHTHTNTGSKSVPEKARAVADHIYHHHDSPVKDEDVELAIENIADVGDDRSVQKYKGQLKKRDLLFKHPFQPIWTDNKREWVGWVEGAMVETDIHDVTADYGVDFDEYDELADEVVADE